MLFCFVFVASSHNFAMRRPFPARCGSHSAHVREYLKVHPQYKNANSLPHNAEAWINQRLKQEGYPFSIHIPTPAMNIEGGEDIKIGSITVTDSEGGIQILDSKGVELGKVKLERIGPQHKKP